jgi:hypothetical protein
VADTTVLRSSAINRTPNAGAKAQAQLSGALPVVQVNMNSGGPQVQNGRGTPRQGVTLLPPKGARRQFTTGGLPNQGAKPAVVILPPQGTQGGVEVSLSADQLLFCRYLVDKRLGELRQAGTEPDETTRRDLDLGEATLSGIDSTLNALTAAAAMAAAPPPRAVTVGSRGQANAAPRRVVRPGAGAPPPVVVQMDAGQPVVVQETVDTHDVQGTGPRRVPRPTAEPMDVDVAGESA